MADAAARKLQYEYKANSNLVLTADKSLIDRRPRNEATGEVVSLVGHLEGIRMGDRCVRTKPSKEDLFEGPSTTKRTRLSLLSSVEDAADTSGLVYVPKSRECAQAYEALLTYVHNWLGDQPRDVLCGAAEEILFVLRNERLRDREKRLEIESLMGLSSGRLSDDRLSVIMSLSRKIVDFGVVSAAAVEAEDDVEGVNVQFDDDDDSVGDVADMVEDEDAEADDEDGLEKSAIGILKEEVELAAGEDRRLDPRAIDAYWLQRQLAKAYDDPNVAQTKAQQVLEAMKSAKDERELENQLVLLLGFAQFDLIKTLRLNKNQVLFGTLLASAQTSGERARVEDQMRADPVLEVILAQISDIEPADPNSSSLCARSRPVAAATTSNEPAAASNPEMHVLDLEDLVFSHGSHFMANKRCQLPEGSFRKQRTGYEEVHVPAPKSRPFEKGEKLVSIDELPGYVRPAFESFTALNRVQSRLCERVLESDENLLVCAPTGAGKTNVALLAILREIGRNTREDGTICVDAFKIIYIAPMRSLVQEMVGNFSRRLACYGLRVSELTGDHQLTKAEIDETQVIVCTPEKWDVVTRKGGDRVYSQLVRLLILDEIHLLHDDRGPVLEAIVARTLRAIDSNQMETRFVALSATLPNYDDIARFLRVRTSSGLFCFDNSYRPVPLEQLYIGVTEKKAVKRHQLMNDLVYQKVLEFGAGGSQQVLVFVHSRKETARTARWIRDKSLEGSSVTSFLRGEGSAEILRTEAENAASPDLKDLLPFGFAIHHAGLGRVDRTLVEDLFADRHISVLVSTATLAWGVNLPAHVVIIKGTQVYSPEKGRWVELGALDVMQMLGRAGRPQYDRKGTGVLLTTHTQLHYYLSLMNQQLPIESQMVGRLVDNMNAEAVLGTIPTVEEAANWISYTYLYIRMLRNPTLYGIPVDEIDSDPNLSQRRKDLAHTACVQLHKAGLINYDGHTIESTALGRIASHYYVTSDTIQIYNQLLRPTVPEIELIRIFSLSSEFRHLRVREEEKLELSRLIERVPFPVKESVEEPTAKVNVLLQAHISQLPLDGFSLATDMVYVVQSASRLMRAIFEIVLSRQWAQLANKCLNFAKMIDRRMWSCMCPLRQFKKIPDEIVRKIERKIIPWERFYDMGPHEIGELIRAPKLGKSLYRYIHEIPRLECAVHVLPITRSMLRVELVLKADFEWDEKVHGKGAEGFWIMVEDADSERLLHHEYFVLKAKYCAVEHFVYFYVPIYEPVPPQYFVRIVSDRWLTGGGGSGGDLSVAISFEHLILPEKFAPCTDLLDLQLLPKSAIGCDWLEQSYSWSLFNPIQTQVFNIVFNTDENVFLGAPVGCGKTVLAELAIFRALPHGRCVYIHARDEVIGTRMAEFRRRFPREVSIVRLTGDSVSDLKLISSANLVLSTARHWDSISRRWRQRKVVQSVKLFVVDDVHLVGFRDSAAIEAVCSRIRYMSTTQSSPVRLVALSASTAILRDMSSWLGCPNGAFNFHPSVRPQRLSLTIRSFTQSHTPTRLLTMSKQIHESVVSHPDQTVLVFVSGRRQTKLTCIDLVAFSLNADDSEALKLELDDPYLAECVKRGIGYLHEGSSLNDYEQMRNNFGLGTHKIRVLVVSQQLCWRLNDLRSDKVILADTVLYNPQNHSYEDYPMCDIIEICGRAVREALVLCHSSKVDYLHKFLFDPIPIESSLANHLHDHFNAEIVAGTIETKQDAVDYLTWTLMYRRMTQNPNYYNLAGLTHRHLSDHLSQLVESVLNDLHECKCVLVDELSCGALNLAMIATYYYIGYRTLELFSRTLTQKTRTSRALLELVASSAEFEDQLVVRHGEQSLLRQLEAPRVHHHHQTDLVSLKAHAMIYAHLSRTSLPGELSADVATVTSTCAKLLHACVDILSSNGWLTPALVAMETVQMVVQAVWPDQNKKALRQIPNFNEALIEKCDRLRIESVFDLMEMDDQIRQNDLLSGLSKREVAEVARFCNSYPNLEFSFKAKVLVDGQVVSESENERLEGFPATEESSLVLSVRLEQDELAGNVAAPFFGPREQGWWVVVGEPAKNRLLAIKRILMRTRTEISADLELANLPNDDQKVDLKVYLMSDSYIGCDQEYQLSVLIRK